VLFTPAPVSGIEPEATVVIPPREDEAISVEAPHLSYNATQGPRLLDALRPGAFDLVYLRHALGAYAGVEAAQAAGLPLVVEFNGSEVWIARNWGAARAHMDLFLDVERTVLRAADLVVAVSEPLRAQLLDLGIAGERILVNPNGVDADRFDRRALAGRRAEIRERLGAGEDTIVVVFVGTFGPWHGAEVFARAAAFLPDDLLRRVRLVFVGDGPRRAATEAVLREGGSIERAVFTGLVPPVETPAWLAAADVAVSPHVPNGDGTEFFGSPTKLFEYMASGTAIVASRIGQIEETLRHGDTAWLVPPGDERALADAVARLARDPALRERLGASAAAEARARYTWDAHVARILERLR
jgi:glycosyltransferase involved in cell wall biosynthesis